jgi:hypothetical protein
MPVTRSLPTEDYINTETLQTRIHTPNVIRIHSPNVQEVEDGRRLRTRGRSGGYVCLCKNHTENKFNLLKPAGYVMHQQV